MLEKSSLKKKKIWMECNFKEATDFLMLWKYIHYKLYNITNLIL